MIQDGRARIRAASSPRNQVSAYTSPTKVRQHPNSKRPRIPIGGRFDKNFSCFIPGAQVTTANGSQNIETVQSNDRILTNGYTEEWGQVSNEKVLVEVTNPTLYCFSMLGLVSKIATF